VATIHEIPNRFEIELQALLNTHSVDNALGMHDFVLAQLITRFLESMIIAKLREKRLGNG
jgi:hypothetical protein